jgi:SAM-dependent methyltransferase
VALASVTVQEEALVSREAWAMLGRSDLEPYTAWDFPNQGAGRTRFGDAGFNGVTPALCVLNLVRRYTRPGDLVVDPMAGSGTIADVARSLGRRAISLDIAPRRRDILRADARCWPLPNGVATLAVIDSPYSDNIVYSDDPRCLGRISCREERFYRELARVSDEAHRVLRPGGILAWIISDEYKGGVYTPVGFRLQTVLASRFEFLDTVVLLRHNDRSASPMWEHRARRYNFLLRGFKFLFLMRRPAGPRGGVVYGRRTGANER